MGPHMKKVIGIVLGLITLLLAIRHFLYTYRDGHPSWYMIVLVCGMLLILYYTLISGRTRDDEEGGDPEDDQTYS